MRTADSAGSADSASETCDILRICGLITLHERGLCTIRDLI